MKLAGTVILYNPTPSLNKNIASYLDYVEKLYVIDNSETSNQDKILSSPKIEYIWNKENLGIAKGLNIACEKSLFDGYDFLLTMDQDSSFKNGALSKLINYANNHDVKKVGIISCYHDVATKIPKSDKLIDYPMEVMTSGNLLNLDVYKKVGPFKEWLFIDSVDTEMCLNMRMNGYNIVRLNDAYLTHHLGNTKIKKILGKEVICSNHNYLRRYYIMRNTLYVTNMYKDIFPDYCKYLRKVQRHQLRNVLLFEKQGIKKFRYMLKGIKDYHKGVVGKKH